MKKNNSKITVPFLSKADIEGKVQEFCRHYGIDRTVVPLDVEVIVEADEKGEPEWRDVTPEDRIKLVDSLTVDEGLSKRNEYDSFPLIPIQQ